MCEFSLKNALDMTGVDQTDKYRVEDGKKALAVMVEHFKQQAFDETVIDCVHLWRGDNPVEYILYKTYKKECGLEFLVLSMVFSVTAEGDGCTSYMELNTEMQDEGLITFCAY